ncbi:MBL fold metallo-hydrolase [Parvibaculum sp.]|uniref:MBL fold metallo-hydrolase n=1 Tax=Parvibaculum sp. TaxID=2024848 RepID=UPI003919079D
MPKWLKVVLGAIGVLLVVGGAAYYWFIVESTMPSDAEYAFDIGEVRRAVAAVPGDKPRSVEVEWVASFSFPATAIVAGDGWSSREMPVYSFRLVYPDKSAIIDTALSEELGGSNLAAFNADAFERMNKAMEEASLIVITHEHMDHIGGITEHPNLSAILPQTKLTEEQLSQPGRSLPARFAEGVLDGFVPLAYDRLMVIAPGVVLIEAPGHTPGSQMVYVQLQDYSEFLFVGDVAWQYRNILTQRQRARLVTQVFLNEDRKAVFGQLAALHALSEAEPEIAIVPGHDGEIVGQLVEAGRLTEGFSLTAD